MIIGDGLASHGPWCVNSIYDFNGIELMIIRDGLVVFPPVYNIRLVIIRDELASIASISI